jgi:transglutaminase-like putative cysteine protease
VDPGAPLSCYTDHHGNAVHFLSLPFRHSRLEIVNRLTVETRPQPPPSSSLSLPLAETRQILRSQAAEIFPYLQFTESVRPHREATGWARRYLRPSIPLGEGLESLNDAMHKWFAYESGSTQVSTPIDQVWKQRRGVCQDFAHVMLGILRSARIPCRYVCGYIDGGNSIEGQEDQDVETLVGSLATHAWVEVLVPGGFWTGLDPTNNQWCGQRHVTTAFGEDYRGATPIRGTFKGSPNQTMSVNVSVHRLKS